MLKGTKGPTGTNEEIQTNRLFKHGYRERSAKRGLAFTLTKKYFKKLIKSNCAYCGKPPSNNLRGMLFNSIDRVDNHRGYYKDNCVSCCKECNWIKGNCILTFKEMRAIAQGLLNYRRALGGILKQWVPEFLQRGHRRRPRKIR